MSLSKDQNTEVEILNMYTKALELNANNTDLINKIGDHYQEKG